ncbi:helix-turn-helix transcriptional regulator [Alicyclobacillus mengziensis]|uniref:Response regulator transcription factor n=1 Tax=Alicyclobacillus mengziensis TaxID=2931921 RepID=A0A9X7Z699_9BACL|nr:response regulator transcription factor [Alicyclobacillus mengziensis]QSO46008.1 response regulator transcription factor [Alicyclobacillus mengziensis]
MSLRHTSALSRTSRPFPGWDVLMASIRDNQKFLLSAWNHRTAATCRFTEQVRPLVNELMEYLLSHAASADGLVSDSVRASSGNSLSRFVDDFAALVVKKQPLLTVKDAICVLTDYEAMLVTLSYQVLESTETEHAYHYAHDLCNRCLRAVAEHACLPIGPVKLKRTVLEDTTSPFLSRVLTLLGIPSHWPWMAVVQAEPEYRVVDFVRFDETTSSWVGASITTLIQEEVRQHTDTHGTEPVKIAHNLYLVLRQVTDPLPQAVHRQLVRWLRTMLLLSGSPKVHEPYPSIGTSPVLAERLLVFDEHLLTARDVSEVLSTVAKDVCSVCGFHRSALFLYNPLTQTVEGIYAHHVDLDEVRQIRESERSIPLIHQMTQFSKPLYFEDVSKWMPKHYVQHFHLSSLFICPIQGPYGQAVGVLIVDNAGKPFRADEPLREALDLVLRRTTFALSRHLEFPRKAVQPVNSYALTTRELEILRLIAEGLETKATAKRLHISDYTVSEHISAVFRKLQVKNRTEAVAKALREGVIQ